MSEFYQGQHVWARFPGGEVLAVVLQSADDGLTVQELGTERADWVPESKCRPA